MARLVGAAAIGELARTGLDRPVHRDSRDVLREAEYILRVCRAGPQGSFTESCSAGPTGSSQRPWRPSLRAARGRLGADLEGGRGGRARARARRSRRARRLSPRTCALVHSVSTGRASRCAPARRSSASASSIAAQTRRTSPSRRSRRVHRSAPRATTARRTSRGSGCSSTHFPHAWASLPTALPSRLLDLVVLLVVDLFEPTQRVAGARALASPRSAPHGRLLAVDALRKRCWVIMVRNWSGARAGCGWLIRPERDGAPRARARSARARCSGGPSRACTTHTRASRARACATKRSAWHTTFFFKLRTDCSRTTSRHTHLSRARARVASARARSSRCVLNRSYLFARMSLKKHRERPTMRLRAHARAARRACVCVCAGASGQNNGRARARARAQRSG